MADDLADFPVTATFQFGELAMLRSLLLVTPSPTATALYDKIGKILDEAYVRYCVTQKNYFRDQQPQ